MSAISNQKITSRRTELALISMDRALPSHAILTDLESRQRYMRDESEAEPTLPDAVVRVSSTREASAVMAAAYLHEVPVTPRAGGTGRTGGAVPTAGGIVLSFEAFDQLLSIDREDQIAIVEPGLVLGDLHNQVENENLFYPPDPNSAESCRLGGNIAENAGGPRAFGYGVTRDYTLGLEVVLPNGSILEIGRRTRKGVTGYDLTSLMVGSEGTLALITRATLHLIPKPEQIGTLMVFVDEEEAIARAVTTCLESRVKPRCVELLDRWTLQIMRSAATVPIPKSAAAMLLIEVDGPIDRVEEDVQTLGSLLVDAGASEVLIAKHGGDRERLWSLRRQMSRTLRTKANHKLSEDVVVPRSKLASLLKRIEEISDRHNIRMPAYGHAGDGNLHVNFLWDEACERPRVDAAIADLFENVIALGGTLSGEHGIGMLKAPYLPLELSPEVIELSRGIKAQFDPKGILNPGKIFPTPGRKKLHGAC